MRNARCPGRSLKPQPRKFAQKVKTPAFEGLPYVGPRFLYPPRPELAIPAEELPRYEAMGWWAQFKLNGTCSVIAVSPDRRLFTWMRDKAQHTAWRATEANRQAFLGLPGDGWYVFVAELMHSKVPGLRNINYLHDILVADSIYLAGSTFADRQELLASLFPNRTKALGGAHEVIDAHTWLAINYRPGIKGGFRKLFQSLERPEHEGLVLKDPTATLNLCFKPDSNSAWQRKCRRPKTAFNF